MTAFPLRQIGRRIPAGLASADRIGALGKHVIADFFECDTLPDDVDQIRDAMTEAAVVADATVVESVFHRFNPHGLSGVVVIAESHLAIHTWPEHRCASIDLFTCGSSLAISRGLEFLKSRFGARTVDVLEIPRGLGVEQEALVH